MRQFYSHVRRLFAEKRLLFEKSAFDEFRPRRKEFDHDIPKTPEIESPEIVQLREDLQKILTSAENQKAIVDYISDSLVSLSLQPAWRAERFDLKKALRITQQKLHERFGYDDATTIMKRIMYNRFDPSYREILYKESKKINDYIVRESRYREHQGERVAKVVNYRTGTTTYYREKDRPKPMSKEEKIQIAVDMARNYKDPENFREFVRPNAGGDSTDWRDEIRKQIAWETRGMPHVKRDALYRERVRAYGKRVARIRMGLTPVPVEDRQPTSVYRDLTDPEISPDDPRITVQFESDEERQEAINNILNRGFASMEQYEMYRKMNATYGFSSMYYSLPKGDLAIVWERNVMMVIDKDGKILEPRKQYTSKQMHDLWGLKVSGNTMTRDLAIDDYLRRKRKGDDRIKSAPRVKEEPATKKEWVRPTYEHSTTMRSLLYGFEHTLYELIDRYPDSLVHRSKYRSAPYEARYPYYGKESSEFLGVRDADVYFGFSGDEKEGYTIKYLYIEDQKGPITAMMVDGMSPEDLAKKVYSIMTTFLETKKRSPAIKETVSTYGYIGPNKPVIRKSYAPAAVADGEQITIEYIPEGKVIRQTLQIPRDIDHGILYRLGIVITKKTRSLGSFGKSYYEFQYTRPINATVKQENDDGSYYGVVEPYYPGETRSALHKVFKAANRRWADRGEEHWVKYYDPADENTDYAYFPYRDSPSYFYNYWQGGFYAVKQGDKYYKVDMTDYTWEEIPNANVPARLREGAPGEKARVAKEQAAEQKEVITPIEKFGDARGTRIVMDQYNTGWIGDEDEVTINYKQQDGSTLTYNLQYADTISSNLARDGILVERRYRQWGGEPVNSAYRVSFTRPQESSVYHKGTKVHTFDDAPRRAALLKSRFEYAKNSTELWSGTWVEYADGAQMRKVGETYYGRFGNQYYELDPKDYTWVKIEQTMIPLSPSELEPRMRTSDKKAEIIKTYGIQDPEVSTGTVQHLLKKQGNTPLRLLIRSDTEHLFIDIPGDLLRTTELLTFYNISVQHKKERTSDGSEREYYEIYGPISQGLDARLGKQRASTKIEHTDKQDPSTIGELRSITSSVASAFHLFPQEGLQHITSELDDQGRSVIQIAFDDNQAVWSVFCYLENISEYSRDIASMALMGPDGSNNVRAIELHQKNVTDIDIANAVKKAITETTFEKQKKTRFQRGVELFKELFEGIRQAQDAGLLPPDFGKEEEKPTSKIPTSFEWQGVTYTQAMLPQLVTDDALVQRVLGLKEKISEGKRDSQLFASREFADLCNQVIGIPDVVAENTYRVRSEQHGDITMVRVIGLHNYDKPLGEMQINWNTGSVRRVLGYEYQEHRGHGAKVTMNTVKELVYANQRERSVETVLAPFGEKVIQILKKDSRVKGAVLNKGTDPNIDIILQDNRRITCLLPVQYDARAQQSTIRVSDIVISDGTKDDNELKRTYWNKLDPTPEELVDTVWRVLQELDDPEAEGLQDLDDLERDVFGN